MIVMRIKGGLGNQLFQYAAAYALSKRLGQEFAFDPYFTTNMTLRGYKIPHLCISTDKIISIDQLPGKVQILKNAYVNKACRMLNMAKHRCGDYLYWLETKDKWQADFFTVESENMYVDGYFQSEDYFKNYRTELLEQFRPNYEPEEEYLKALDTIKRCTSVAVHVRRSDFKKDNCKFHYLLGEEYYYNALQYVETHVENPVFFWFSDDIDWVKRNFGERTDFRFISLHTKHADIDEMMLMKSCKHIIAANSTFSWWASWLNENGRTLHICPKKNYGNLNMIPDSWIKVAVE